MRRALTEPMRFAQSDVDHDTRCWNADPPAHQPPPPPQKELLKTIHCSRMFKPDPMVQHVLNKQKEGWTNGWTHQWLCEKDA